MSRALADIIRLMSKKSLPPHVSNALKKFLQFLGLPILLLLISLTPLTPPISTSNLSFADELSDVEKKIDKTSKKLEDLNSEKAQLQKLLDEFSKNLSATEADIKELSLRISQMEDKLLEINLILDQKKSELSSKIDLRNKIVRAFYEEDSSTSYLEFFLHSLNFSNLGELSGFQSLAQSFIAKRTLTKNALTAIGFLNKDISEYESNKKVAEDIKNDLGNEKIKLAALKEDLSAKQDETKNQLSQLDEEIKKVNESLAELSSKQQELLREKFGATSESNTIGDGEQASSTLPDPPFKPAFAFFTYGYPHRVGASQYGMYGRSKAGQSYKDIIKAYFKDVEISGSCDKGKTIPVVGYGNLKLEDTYLMGIAEMPESWGGSGGLEALKAQVVLSRTYALNYTGYFWDSPSQSLKKRSKSVSICTTQSCQVYSGGKKTGYWKQAVNDTCGVTVKYNGNPITAWYASTAGGYTRTSAQVWGSSRPWSKGIRDTKCSGNLFDCAYDGPNSGKSPWFHKAWGVNKSSGSAWMKESEVQDMFNSYLLSEKNSSYNQYLSPVDKGGWSFDKVKSKLNDLSIKPVGAIKDITARDDGTGYTTSLVLDSENYSNKSFDGYKFKSVFNLRSPGTLVLWTSFYDVLIKN